MPLTPSRQRVISGGSLRSLASLLSLLCLTAAPRLASGQPGGGQTPITVGAKGLPRVHVDGLAIGKGRVQELEGIQNDFAAIIAAEFEGHGYSSSTGQASESPFVLRGNVVQFDCSETKETTCGIGIDWLLVDQRREIALYRVTSRHEESGVAARDRDEAARALLIGAVRSLLSRRKFVSVLEASVMSGSTDALTPAVLATCRRGTLSLPDDSEKALDATAVVRAKAGVGTAVFVSPDGYLLTAAHVVGAKRSVGVVPRDGRELRARVVRLDQKRDVALLRVEGKRADWACLTAREREARAGEDVYVLGTPAGEEFSFSISRGILSGRRIVNQSLYLQTDASVNPGNSGGPLLDGAGTVLGIVSWKMSGRAIEGLGFAVPIGVALDVLALSFSDATSAWLAEETPTVQRMRGPVVDKPDPPFAVAGRRIANEDPAWSTWVRGAGFLGLSVGGTLVLVTGVGQSDGYYNARPLNRWGWGIAGVGTAMVLSSYVIPILGSKEDGGRESASQGGLEALVGPGTVTLRARY
jgi:S1-C subfamily serine protease